MIITYVSKELIQWVKDNFPSLEMPFEGEQKTSLNSFNDMNHLPISQYSELIGVIDDPKQFYVVDRSQERLLLNEVYATGPLQFKTDKQLNVTHHDHVYTEPLNSLTRIPERQINAAPAEPTNQNQAPANNSLPPKTVSRSVEPKEKVLEKAMGTFCDQNRIAIPKTVDVYCINRQAERYEIRTNNKATPVYRVIDDNDNKVFSDETRVPNDTVIWPRQFNETHYLITAQVEGQSATQATETGYKRMFTKLALEVAKRRKAFPNFSGAINDKAPYVINERSKIKKAPTDASPVAGPMEARAILTDRKTRRPTMAPDCSLFFDSNGNPIASTQKIFKINQRANYFITHPNGTTQRIYQKTDSNYLLANGTPAPTELMLWPMRNMQNPSNQVLCVLLNNEMRLVYTSKTYRDVRKKRSTMSKEEIREEHEYYNCKNNFLGEIWPKQSITHAAPKQFTIPPESPAHAPRNAPAKKYRFQTGMEIVGPHNLIQEGEHYYIQHGHEQIPVWSEYQYQTRIRNPNLEKIYIYEDDGSLVPAKHQLQIKNNRYYTVAPAGGYERPVFVEFRKKPLVLIEPEDNTLEPNQAPSSDLLSFCSASQQVFSDNLEADLLALNTGISNLALETPDEASFAEDLADLHWLPATPMQETKQESYLNLPDPEEMSREEDPSLIDEDLQPFYPEDYPPKTVAPLVTTPLVNAHPSSSTLPEQRIALTNTQTTDNTSAVSNKELFAVSCEVSSLVEDLYLARLNQTKSKEISPSQEKPAELSRVQTESEATNHPPKKPAERSLIHAKSEVTNHDQAEPEEVSLILAELANESYEQEVKLAELNVTIEAPPHSSPIPETPKEKEQKEDISAADTEEFYYDAIKSKLLSVSIEGLIKTPLISSLETYLALIKKVKQNSIITSKDYAKWLLTPDNTNRHPLFITIGLKEQTFLLYLNELCENLSKEELCAELLGKENGLTALHSLICKSLPRLQAYFKALSQQNLPPQKLIEFLNQYDAKGLTVLQKALLRGDSEVLFYYLEQVQALLPAKKDFAELLVFTAKSGLNTLQYAARAKDSTIFKRYLNLLNKVLTRKQLGELLLHKSPNNYTILHDLVTSGNSEGLNTFLDFLDSSIKEKIITDKEYLELLTTKSAGGTPLKDILRRGNSKHLELYLNKLERVLTKTGQGAIDYFYLLTQSDQKKQTYLHEAISAQDPAALTRFLSTLAKLVKKHPQLKEKYAQFLISINQDTATPLSYALQSSNLELLKNYFKELKTRLKPEELNKFLFETPAGKKVFDQLFLVRDTKMYDYFTSEIQSLVRNTHWDEEYSQKLLSANHSGFSPLVEIIYSKNEGRLQDYFKELRERLAKKHISTKQYAKILLQGTNNGLTPLHQALASGNETILHLYLQELKSAVAAGWISAKEYAQYLIQLDHYKSSPLCMSRSKINKEFLVTYLDEVKLQVKKGLLSVKNYIDFLTSSNRNGYSPITCLIESQSLDAFLVYWQQVEKVCTDKEKVPLLRSCRDGYPILYHIIQTNDVTIFTFYLEKLKEHLDKRLSRHEYARLLLETTPLGDNFFQAIVRTENAQLLALYLREVKTYCSTEERSELFIGANNAGFTPLHQLMIFGNAKQLQTYFNELEQCQLSAKTYKSVLTTTNKQGFSLLLDLVQYGDLEKLELYFEKLKKYVEDDEIAALLMQANKAGFTPLQDLLQSKGDPKKTELFIEKLLFYVPKDKLASVLFSHNKAGYTLLLSTVIAANPDNLVILFKELDKLLAKKLITQDDYSYILTQPNASGFTPLQEAFVKKEPLCLRIYLDKLKKHLSPAQLRTLFFAHNKEGFTVLHQALVKEEHAVKHDSHEIVQLCLSELKAHLPKTQYASILIKPTNAGFTPLHQILKLGNFNSYSLYMKELQSVRNHISDKDYLALLTTPNRGGFTPLKQAVFGSSFQVVKELMDLLEKELSADEFYKALFHKNKNGDYFTTNAANNDYVAIKSLLSTKRNELRDKLQVRPQAREEESHRSEREKRGPHFFTPAKEHSTSSRSSEQRKEPSSHRFVTNMNQDSRAEKHRRNEDYDSHSSKRHDRRERDRDQGAYRHEHRGRDRDREDARHERTLSHRR